MVIAGRALIQAGYLGPVVWLVTVLLMDSVLFGDDTWHRFISEHGIPGSPTESIYRFGYAWLGGFLFAALGVHLLASEEGPWRQLCGLCVVLHGLARLGASFFPCDAGCVSQDPSASQGVHNMLALLMYGTLLSTVVVWPTTQRTTFWFRWYSLISAAGMIGLWAFMIDAMSSHTWVGLFQRGAYGLGYAWIVVLTWTQVVQSPSPAH